MAFHDDMLRQAEDSIRRTEPDCTQADLRRAVSTAYYSVFHLLIHEATQNWSRLSSRASLGRMFEHSWMRKTSARVRDRKASPFLGEDPHTVEHLRQVAHAFVELQDQRHIADYHSGINWAIVEALEEVKRARDAFESWAAIRDTDLAQDYLVSLLIRPRD